MALKQHPAGNYQFLPTTTSAPFSGGVVANTGYEIIHASLQAALPCEQGFAMVQRHLQSLGRPRAALCAVELRCPTPYTPDGFGAFNKGYRALLQGWGIFVDGYSPTARTNVAPAIAAPAEPVLHAFSYTIPNADASATATFVVSGAGEQPSVRAGETSPDALREKTADVMAAMQTRLANLGVGWQDVTAVDVYTVHPLIPLLEQGILAPIGPAAGHGIHWYYSRPPVQGLEIEIDVRGVRQELRLRG